MISFERLRQGGRFTMLYRKRDQAFPVSVKPHPIDNNAILVKHLDANNRGSMGAVYKDQIDRGTITFEISGKDLTNLRITYVPAQAQSKSTPEITYLQLFDILLLLLIVIVLFHEEKQSEPLVTSETSVQSVPHVFTAVDIIVVYLLTIRVIILLKQCLT